MAEDEKKITNVEETKDSKDVSVDESKEEKNTNNEKEKMENESTEKVDKKPVEKDEKIVNAKGNVADNLAEKAGKTEMKDKKKLEDYRTIGEPSKAKKSESAVKKAGNKPKKEEKKEVELERIYIVPMRRGFMKVPAYKRAKKAIKTLKEFLAKHMKVEERDLNKVKIDMYLNNEIWFKGIKKPLAKIKVKVKKIDGIVYAELADIPDVVKFAKQKNERRGTKVDKKKLDKVVTQEAAEEKIKANRSDKADKTETKEKEAATAEAGLEKNKDMANAQKHTAKAKSAKVDNMSATTQRKALKK